MRRLGFAYDDYAFDAYAVLAIGIVARLYARCELINRTRCKHVPLETVIPALNDVLLYAMREA
jgi:hypothetical protein